MKKSRQTLKKKVSELQSMEAKKNGGKIVKGSKISKDQSLVDSSENITKKEASKIQSSTAKTQKGIIQKGSVESAIQSIANSID